MCVHGDECVCVRMYAGACGSVVCGLETDMRKLSVIALSANKHKCVGRSGPVSPFCVYRCGTAESRWPLLPPASGELTYHRETLALIKVKAR